MTSETGLRDWLVFTPPYAAVAEYIAGFPRYETAADVVEVRARTRREAITLGGLEMLRLGYRWVHDNRSDGVPPWKGLKAELAEGPEAVPA
jgi:hypothetical protein